MIAAVGARSGAQPAAGAPSCLQRFLIAGCLALLLGILGAFARLWQTGGMAANKTDFVPYYSVARMVMAGHGRLMYALKPLGSLETTLVRPLHVKDGVMPYLYPPHFAFLLAPLARLPLNLAFAAWLLINLCLLAASLRLLQRSSGVTGWDALVLWLAGCSFFPVLLALAQGQTSILLLALLTVALV
ncbi:MAG: glycosyltransferase 87 family protein, partial [Chloroflexota bacterium]